jgi:hypothetical protein
MTASIPTKRHDVAVKPIGAQRIMDLSTAGTRPHHPVYPPPVPSGFADPGGKTPVEHAHRTQQAVAKAYTDWRAAHSKDIAPGVLRDNAGAFAVSDPALALDDVLGPVKTDAEEATAKVNQLIRNHRVGADVANQIAAQRYWDRSRRTLDSITNGAKAVAAAQDLVANADDEQVPVLAEELSDYLGQRGLPAGWLPAALAARVPGLADAQADAILKARQRAVLLANDQKLRRAIAADTDAPPLIDPAQVNSEPYSDGYV